MLRLIIPATEKWDDEKQEFIYQDAVELELEHSLVSVSKWESKWCKAFLTNKDKTVEETIDYIKCMTITPNVPDSVYECLTNTNVLDVCKYIESPMTATVFSKDNSKPSREVITSEIIYYWMIALNIPIAECQYWHLNRLLTLIRVCNIKNNPPKKMGRAELLRRNAELNAARRKKLGTKG